MNNGPGLTLDDGARIAVIGGGPAGSFVSYFILEMASRIDLDVSVDIFEPRDFSLAGPPGCNMCGGIVSESLVQFLAVEGINLPSSVVKHGIESYMLHTDVGHTPIGLPLQEMRIAAMHRGSGPTGYSDGEWESFDAFLLNMACERGATHIRARVKEGRRQDGRPVLTPAGMQPRSYDLVVGACGISTKSAALFADLGLSFGPIKTARAYIGEMRLGRETVKNTLGNAMHTYLLDLPGSEFGALIPKDEYVTICILGDDVDAALVSQFMNSPEVTGTLGMAFTADSLACRCSPRLNVGASGRPFADRVVLVGDCGVSRLYKDGIGAVHRQRTVRQHLLAHPQRRFPAPLRRRGVEEAVRHRASCTQSRGWKRTFLNGRNTMRIGALGKVYEDGQIIVQQGELGNCMYVIQKGRVAVVHEGDSADTRLATLEAGDVFGEMALFTKRPRTATVKADGRARVMTIDKRQFLKRTQEDPSLAFDMLKRMSRRVEGMNRMLAEHKGGMQS